MRTDEQIRRTDYFELIEMIERFIHLTITRDLSYGTMTYGEKCEYAELFYMLTVFDLDLRQIKYNTRHGIDFGIPFKKTGKIIDFTFDAKK